MAFVRSVCSIEGGLLRWNPTSSVTIGCKHFSTYKTDTGTFEGPPSNYIADIKPKILGYELLKNSRLNKGLAFTEKERHFLGLEGLFPAIVMTEKQQAHRVLENLKRQPDDLGRYVQLRALHDRNEKLFYYVLCENIESLMPIVYTPTVGQACQKFGFIFRKPRGIYLTTKHNSVQRICEVLRNWPEPNVRAIVMTDGERILGLGDLGAYGMGIPIGKMALYVALGRIQPQWCLPLQLDVGTDNEDLLNDEFYIGVKQKRLRGPEFDQFIDNVMQAIVLTFGQQTLIQFEDFANHNAFRLLERYREKYLTFNDDIQGTASVVAAGLMAATRITSKPLEQNCFFFFGAGEAATGAATLLCAGLQKRGLSFEQAAERIWMMDKNGLLTKERKDLSSEQVPFAKGHPHLTGLEEAINDLKPTALIGASTVGGAFNQCIVDAMIKFNERPIIFALSNPTAKAECTAEQAYSWSNGKAVFASGSPFPCCTVNDKLFHPGQGNNAYIFPGVSLGALLSGVRHIHDDLFLTASETLANLVTQAHLDEGRVYPPLKDIPEISVQIAIAIAERCFKNKTAFYYPEPADKEAFIRSQLYRYEYSSFDDDV